MRSDAVATRARILGAAERLFAERGIDAVSLSAINRAAGQRNKSATQYHFGSKEGLLTAILEKHTPGIELRRHAMLDEMEARGVADLRALVEALVLPVAEKLEDPDGGISFVRVNAQLIGNPSFPLLEAGTRRADRLMRLTASAAPHLPEPLRVPRWLLVSGLLFHAISDYSRLADGEAGRLIAPPRALFISNLIDALEAMIAAPASTETRKLVRRAAEAGAL